jgi:molybdopterin converting factor small subunit
MTNERKNKVDPKALEATCGKTLEDYKKEYEANKPRVAGVEAYDAQPKDNSHRKIGLSLIAAGAITGIVTMIGVYFSDLEQSLKTQEENLSKMKRIEYIVQKGEVLGEIRKKYIKNPNAYRNDLLDEEIKKVNHKKDSNIKEGELIYLFSDENIKYSK